MPLLCAHNCEAFTFTDFNSNYTRVLFLFTVQNRVTVSHRIRELGLLTLMEFMPCMDLSVMYSHQI